MRSRLWKYISNKARCCEKRKLVLSLDQIIKINLIRNYTAVFHLQIKSSKLRKIKIHPKLINKIIKIKKGPSFSFRIKKFETPDVNAKIYSEKVGKNQTKAIVPESKLPNIRNQRYFKTNDIDSNILIQKQ